MNMQVHERVAGRHGAAPPGLDGLWHLTLVAPADNPGPLRRARGPARRGPARSAAPIVSDSRRVSEESRCARRPKRDTRTRWATARSR
uniref:Uncharacterized protein n=1 Tax=Nonomuraea gerenzanensis TaxID=93944 RepID=A0A1M4E755_9ACTN|nr:hypothetical protein BN4615_P4168 [Nonomuraea gerenzanensis]